MNHPLLQNSFGNRPQVLQDDVFPEGIVAMDLAAEARTLLAGTGSGHLMLLGPAGEQLARERGFDGLRHLAWSDVGNFAVVALENGRLICLDGRLSRKWEVDLTGEIVGLALSPFGSHIAVSTESAYVHLVTTDRKEVGKFNSTRPLEFLQFLYERPLVVGAAEFGHLCCHDLDGSEQWNERIMNNVGSMSVTGDGRRILLAAFNHGVQVLNSSGRQKGSFVVDGIPDFVAAAANRRRLAVRTLEHRLYWLNFDGDVSWGCDFASDPAHRLCVGPLGDRLYVATQSGRLLQLAW
ncbi:MAG: hypothetical protein RIK87_27215 [Fuerstiella sp.]